MEFQSYPSNYSKQLDWAIRFLGKADIETLGTFYNTDIKNSEHLLQNLWVGLRRNDIPEIEWLHRELCQWRRQARLGRLLTSS